MVADGRSESLGTRKERLLLCLLLVDRSTVSLDRIVDALWESDPPGKPETSIRSYVSNIRRSLGTYVEDPMALLVSEDGGYSLDLGECVVDVDQFEQLVEQARSEPDKHAASRLLDEALNLVRGEPLADMAYAEFAQAEIRRLSELILSAEELRVEVGIELGQAAQLLPRVSALVEAHPLREALRHAHMTALAVTGRTAEALRSYQEHRLRLVEEMGIEPGPGLRDLEAQILAEDGPFADPASVVSVAATTATPAPAATPPTVERRQLTIITCDVAAPAIAGRRDPEDLRRALQEHGPIWREIVAGFGGRVHRLAGNTMIAYFGYPTADEDDAERAIRAGLEIVKRSDGLARVGVATGTVIVEPHPDFVDTGAVDLVGEAPDLAFKLCDGAVPGGVVVSAETHLVTQDRFRFDQTEHQNPDGGISVTAALRPLTRQQRSNADHLSPLAGRDEELALLTRRFNLAKEGDGQVVFLAGEAGVGKSRIVAELVSQLRQNDEQVAVLLFHCSAFHQSSALQPIVEHVFNLAGCEELDRVADRAEKLEALFKRSPIGDELRLISSLANADEGLSVSEKLPDPTERRERLLEAALAIIATAQEDGPLVCVLEDAHWIDASTRALLDRLIDGSLDQRLLLIVTHRSGQWSELETTSNSTALNLSPIARSECLSIARHLAGDQTLPEDIAVEIVRKSDGIPLFVEEITKAVLEQHRADPESTDSATRHHYPVPMTLHDSLMARLDRSPEGRSLAQTAAAIGHAVNPRLLAAVGSTSLDDLGEELESLVSAGILISRGDGPTATYRFRHALIRDTAYQSLLREARWSLHARIASVLESEWQDTAAVDPVLLAQQWEAATESDRAADWWRIAAKRAIEALALDEAIDCVSRGMALVEQHGDGPDWAGRRIELLLLRGVAESQLHGPGSVVVGRTFEQVLDHGAETLSSEQYYSALWGCWYHDTINEQRRSRSEHAEQLYQLATTMNDVPLLIEAHHVQWSSLILDGELERSFWHTEQVDQMYDHDEHHGLTYTYGGHDPGVCMHGIGALAAWLLGRPQEAAAHIGLATSLTDHAYSVLEGSFGPLVIALMNRDLDAVLAHTARLETLVTKGSIPPTALGFARGFEGAVRAETDDLERAAELLAEASSGWRGLWGAYCYPLDAVHADTMSRQGHHDAALSLIDEILGQTGDQHSPWWDAEFHRIRGQIQARANDRAADCLERFEQAAEIARSQQATALEIRALRDQVAHGGRLGVDQDGPVARLQDLLNSYSEETDVLDVLDARQVLSET